MCLHLLCDRSPNWWVVLLDSKCYPLLDNESTNGEAFWKSTQKVLAANRDLYNKLTSQRTDLEVASIDLTCEDTAEESDSSGQQTLSYWSHSVSSHA